MDEASRQFPFALREHDYWRHFVEYTVDDHRAEVVFLEQLGFEPYFRGDDLVIVRSPARDITLGIRRSDEAHVPAPKSSLSVQFFVTDAEATECELRARGIAITSPVEVVSGMCELRFHSPAGILYHVWSIPED